MGRNPNSEIYSAQNPLTDTEVGLEGKRTKSQETYQPISKPTTTPTFEEYQNRIIAQILPEIKELIEDKSARHTESLAVFVALFTFISIEFQSIKGLDYYRFLLFSPLFAALLSLFILLLHFTLHSDEKKSYIGISIFFIVLLVTFTLVLIFSEPQNTIANP